MKSSETTADNRFTLLTTSCLGICAVGLAVPEGPDYARGERTLPLEADMPDYARGMRTVKVQSNEELG